MQVVDVRWLTVELTRRDKDIVSAKPSKRNYRNTLDFVESGFRACWHNAKDLLSASQKLMDGGLQAPALSLSVLTLEELGKLLAIDGLLYARVDDDKSTAFTKSGRSHASKLALLDLFPLLLLNLTGTDPRYGKEKRFNAALAISVQDVKDAANAVLQELGEGSFHGLDTWKQRGFYASAAGGEGRFITPSEAVSPSLAKAVHRLAWRAVTTLDFVLKGGSLERYLENARSVRAALTEEEHRELERCGQEAFLKIFSRAWGDAVVEQA